MKEMCRWNKMSSSGKTGPGYRKSRWWYPCHTCLALERGSWPVAESVVAERAAVGASEYMKMGAS